MAKCHVLDKVLNVIIVFSKLLIYLFFNFQGLNSKNVFTYATPISVSSDCINYFIYLSTFFFQSFLANQS